MSQIIRAKFDNVDSAAFAINDVKERFEGGVVDAKLKYHNKRKGKTDFFIAGSVAQNDIYNPVFLNGVMPTALSGIMITNERAQERVREVPKKATVEIVAEDNVTDNVCNTLRSDGGLGITVR